MIYAAGPQNIVNLLENGLMVHQPDLSFEDVGCCLRMMEENNPGDQEGTDKEQDCPQQIDYDSLKFLSTGDY